MNVAETIIERFGGQSKLAEFIGKGQSTVQYWASSGIIPAKWQSVLLRLAQEHGVALTPDEFLQPEQQQEIQRRPRTIIEAVRLVFEEKGVPMTVSEIFNEIVAKRLYLFNTDNPVGVLKSQLRRHCSNLEFPSASAVKHFGLLNNGKYQMLQKAVRVSSNGTSGVVRNPRPSLSARLRLLHGEYVNEVRENILGQVRRLDPGTFELFAKNLMEVYGFEHMQVTPLSRDGGIDGNGKLKVGLAHLNVAFQCKNWRTAVVGRPEIDRFRGATQGRFEQAIFFTTSRFSAEAMEASFRPGAVPVILIDGPGIVDIMIEKQFGVDVDSLPIYSYAIDMAIADEGSAANAAA